MIDTNDSIQTLKLRLINKFGIKVESVTDEFTYQEKLSNLIDAQDLDVSVVVVNSMPIQIGIFKSILSEDGKIESGAFEDMDQENTFNLITSNLTSPTLLIGSLLPRLQKRKNRSAIILASSYFNMKFPFSAIHSAIQEYNRILAATLQEEIKGKVDVLSVFLSGKSVGWYLRYVGKRTSI